MALTRTPEGYLQLLRDQYSLLKDSVNDFYEGNEAKALDIAIRLRTLIHHTDSSRALLSFIEPNYSQLAIYLKQEKPPTGTVLSIKTPFQISVSGEAKPIRDEFTNPPYSLVPLQRWWTEEYLVIGDVCSSKKMLVLDIANKDGGAHVDENVPRRHAAASEPRIIMGTGLKAVRPNLVRTTVAQTGNEFLDYLERHFGRHLRPSD
jgi:hypothetical protein